MQQYCYYVRSVYGISVYDVATESHVAELLELNKVHAEKVSQTQSTNICSYHTS